MVENKLDFIVELIKAEYRGATKKFENFHNAHEGYAVLLEEVDELWRAVKLNQLTSVRNKMMKDEAIQVGAMAIRFLIDVCEG